MFIAHNRNVTNPKERGNTPKLSFISAPSKTLALFSTSAQAKEAGREANSKKITLFYICVNLQE